MLLDTLCKAISKVSIEIISNIAYSCQKARRKQIAPFYPPFFLLKSRVNP